MDVRHLTAVVAAGGVLAIGAPVAQATSTRIAPEFVQQSNTASTAALNAYAQRWKAIGDQYLRQQRLHKVTQRAGILELRP